MAITAMDIIKKINQYKTSNLYATTLLIWMNSSSSVLAGDWQLIPTLNLNETYSDNIELSSVNTSSSFITQTIAGLDAEYKSSHTTLQWSGTQIYALYSHNSELNDNFRTLEANGEYIFWNGGPVFTASGNIANVSRNNARNGLADLVSGDTVEQKNYSTGFRNNFGNSSYTVNSSINYSVTRAEDNIGDNNEFTAQLDSKNGNATRDLYWELNADYTKRDQNNTNNNGENHTFETLVGIITSLNINPFIRYYDENIDGTGVNQNLNTTSSWGPGFRWLATPHITIDLSYNFVTDETISDDYVDTSIQWEPSARTSLEFGYSQRFFGDSYNLDLSHRTKRLTNLISYNESLEVFDRNTFQEITPGSPELIESNEFSLNKKLSWSSQLQLSRTSFGVNFSTNERTSLNTNIIDDTINANINITRTNTPRSNLSLSAAFNYAIYDKNNPAGSRQEDYYRTISVNYTKNLASALYFNFTIQHVNRDSNIDRFSYNEARTIFNITKEF